VIHWVDGESAVDCEVRLYGRLFSAAEPDAGDGDFRAAINPDSLVTLIGCKGEATLGQVTPEMTFQFEREGYFCRDRHSGDALVFNRTIALRDTSTKPTGNQG